VRAHAGPGILTCCRGHRLSGQASYTAFCWPLRMSINYIYLLTFWFCLIGKCQRIWQVSEKCRGNRPNSRKMWEKNGLMLMRSLGLPHFVADCCVHLALHVSRICTFTTNISAPIDTFTDRTVFDMGNVTWVGLPWSVGGNAREFFHLKSGLHVVDCGNDIQLCLSFP